MPKKLTIEDMREIARERGGLCLSKNYSNSRTKFQWQCAKGHVWEAIPKQITRGSWCPECANRRLTIEEMQEIARGRGGLCLSEKYINSKIKLKWQCAKGHVWEAPPSQVKYANWCPTCAGNKRLDLEEMQEIARGRGGLCLSEAYINSSTKLKWQCAKGHVWEAPPVGVKSNGHWCPTCAGVVKSSIEEMRVIAKSRGGLCLSNGYTNAHTKLKWKCDKNHIWGAKPNSIKNGQWCPTCAGKERLTIEEMQEIARSRGGLCLSDDYVNIKSKLKWQCKEGHIWEAVPYPIKKGSWCPVCNSKLGERISRKYLELIFHKNFPKARPGWLVSSNGEKLELDGFCQQENIAFEYQGLQHYEVVKHYHRNAGDLEKRIKYDIEKVKLCEKHGIDLIVIPYTVSLDGIYKYIINECKDRKINIPKHRFVPFLDLGIYSSGLLEEMQEIARGRGGLCLSEKYINSKIKLKWQCAKGHVWEAPPSQVKYANWCPTCAGKERLTIEEMQEIARSRGGLCLSDDYVNIKSKLKWQCKEGHIWEAAPGDIKSDHWCPECGNVLRMTIEEMQEIARSRGGLCLSDVYVNRKTKLRWQCAKGHVWEARPAGIKVSGQWCPTCAGVARLTIEEMQKIARDHGGICLSDKYVNKKTKLRWQCAKGHVWETTPDAVKQRKWCPVCGNARKGIRRNA